MAPEACRPDLAGFEVIPATLTAAVRLHPDRHSDHGAILIGATSERHAVRAERLCRLEDAGSSPKLRINFPHVWV